MPFALALCLFFGLLFPTILALRSIRPSCRSKRLNIKLKTPQSNRQWRHNAPTSDSPDEKKALAPSKKKKPSRRRAAIDADKDLYHKLQNPETYPEALPVGRLKLLELLDKTVSEALASDPEGTILSIPTFSPEALEYFLSSSEKATTDRYSDYLGRRKQGGPRELLFDLDYAKYWIQTAAPVKYVDGSWLGGIHRVSAPVVDRTYTKAAWQILSEELGDGDLEKNHVHVYEKLVKGIGLDIGAGDEKRFIDNSVNPNDDARVWTAAVAQLCVSLYPEEFLPEILGFNMAYESLPCHLLITIHELREFKLDPYYFLLHVVIDNSDSGHACMGKTAVTELLLSTSPESRDQMWRRVQAGFLLAEGLPTTPKPPNALEQAINDLFGRKCMTAKPMHLSCLAKIGGKNGKSLSEWLDPEKYHASSMHFLRALADSRWIARGNPAESKLIHAMKWNGVMFGAFTQAEEALLERWIRSLEDFETTKDYAGTYACFVGHTPRDYIQPAFPFIPTDKRFDVPASDVSQLLCLPAPENMASIPIKKLASLLIVSAAPFEILPSCPAKCATMKGMAAVVTLRALYGFHPATELVAGMDEVKRGPEDEVIGVVEIGSRIGGSSANEEARDSWIVECAKAPEKNFDFLAGVQLEFVVHFYLNEELWRFVGLEKRDIDALADIGRRCKRTLADIVESGCDFREVVAGFCALRCDIGKCVVDAGGTERQ